MFKILIQLQINVDELLLLSLAIPLSGKLYLSQTFPQIDMRRNEEFETRRGLTDAAYQENSSAEVVDRAAQLSGDSAAAPFST